MRSSINNEILNKMRNESYTKKEEVYAQLIINVLDEANKFSKKLSNVYVNHNIIESIFFNKDMCLFLRHEFGRGKDEFSPKFIKACELLNNQFNKDYPKASDYTADNKINYYTIEYFGVRIFMRKVINKITIPLNIKPIVQPFFVSLDNTEQNWETHLWLNWYSGKRFGNYIMNEEYPIERKLNKSEILKLQTKIETAANQNEEILDCDVIEEIIDAFLQSQKQESELILVS